MEPSKTTGLRVQLHMWQRGKRIIGSYLLEHLAEAIGVAADVGERSGLYQKSHFQGRGRLQVGRLLSTL